MFLFNYGIPFVNIVIVVSYFTNGRGSALLTRRPPRKFNFLLVTFSGVYPAGKGVLFLLGITGMLLLGIFMTLVLPISIPIGIVEALFATLLRF